METIVISSDEEENRESSVEIESSAIMNHPINRHKDPLPFTVTEDSCLRRGIEKFGSNTRSWLDMLKDDTLMFHPLRSCESLKWRAFVLGLSPHQPINQSTLINDLISISDGDISCGVK